LPDHGQREARYTRGAAVDAVLDDRPVRVVRAEVRRAASPWSC